MQTDPASIFDRHFTVILNIFKVTMVFFVLAGVVIPFAILAFIGLVTYTLLAQ